MRSREFFACVYRNSGVACACDERNCRFEKLFVCHKAHVLAVEPFKLLVVENGRRFVEVLKLKELFKLRQLIHVAAVFIRAAEHRNVVYQSFWQIAARPEFVYACRTVSFREFLSVFAHNHRKVAEFRVIPAESLVHNYVHRRRRNPFLGAHYVADFHKMVVNNVCEVICRETVCL